MTPGPPRLRTFFEVATGGLNRRVRSLAMPEALALLGERGVKQRRQRL